MRDRSIMLAVVLAAAMPNTAQAVNCLDYLAADETLRATALELQEIVDGLNANLAEVRNALRHTREAAVEKADRELRQAEAAAEAAHARAKAAASAARREVIAQKDAARQAFRQTLRDADTEWLAAMDKGDRAGMEAAQAKKREAAAVRDATLKELDARNLQTPDMVQRAEAKTAEIAAARAERSKAAKAARKAEEKEFANALRAAEADERYTAARAAVEAAQTRAEDAYIAAYENPAPDVKRETAGYSREVVLKMAKSERLLCPD